MKIHDLYDKSKQDPYTTLITEAIGGPGLFWIVPNREGGHTLLMFSEYQISDHGTLWRTIAADFVLNHFRITNKKMIDRFKDLYNAFPRGRVEAGDKKGEWFIGFGGDYPIGWNEEKLLERLKTPRPTIFIDDFWKTDPTNTEIALKILKS